MKWIATGLLLFVLNALLCQEWNTYFTNDRNIKNFAISKYADELCIFDGKKIKIINSNSSKTYYNRKCTLEYDDGSEYNYTIKFDKVKSLLYSRNYNRDRLNVATEDSIVVCFEHQTYLGSLPFTYIYDTEIYQDEYVASFSLAGVFNFIGEFDIESGKFDPYGNSDSNYVFSQEIRDISIDIFCTVIDSSNNAIINLVEGFSSLKINEFDFNKLPFNKFKEVQGIFGVNYGTGADRRRYNLWAITDKGLAMYKTGINKYKDFENWSEDNWISLSKQNSWLLSNDLFGLHKIYSKYSIGKNLIVFSNTPYPTMYYFNPKGKIICIYNYTNSPMLKNKNITAVSQDSDYGVYIAQGNKILKLTLENDMNCYPLSISDNKINSHQIEIIPNPVSNYFEVKSNDKIKNCSLYSIQGVKMTDFKGNKFRSTSYLKNGIYLLYVNFANGDKSVKKIIIN